MKLFDGNSVKSHDLANKTPIQNIYSDKEFIELAINLKNLQKRYDLDAKKIISLTNNPGINIPISVLSTKELSSFEAIVKYLHEIKKLKFSQIADLTGRNQKTIWCTYNNSKKKYGKELTIKQGLDFPVSAIQKRDYSILETIVGHLKEKFSLTYSQIAAQLNLDPRTVWTCYSRLEKKRAKTR